MKYFYFIQGNILWFLFGGIIKKWYKRVKKCNICFERGSCIECGCDFNKMALTNKCKK